MATTTHPKPSASAVHASASKLPPRGPKRVLVIDDSPDFSAFVEATLTAAGHSVRCAKDGREGLRIALSETPDLIICDVILPEADGFTVVRKLRSDEKLAVVPVVFVSGMEDKANFRRAMRAGADDYLSKPIGADDLLESISVRLERADVLKRHFGSFSEVGLSSAIAAERMLQAPSLAATAASQRLAMSDERARDSAEERAAAATPGSQFVATVPSGVKRAESELPPAATATQSAGVQPMQIPGYRIAERIGEGGMSRVYLAQSEAGGPLHVLKVIEIDRPGDGDHLQRFLQEFALVSQIRHPHVARIYRQGFSEHHAFIAMEYFSGGDLRKAIKAGISTDQSLNYLRQTALALHAIHSRSIVHRDLKPDNLMLRADGTLAIADFGIAKHRDTVITETAQGEVVGTPYYLSPEQASGGALDHRSDYYSLGVILFELLTGKKPYVASTMKDLLELHMNAPVPQLPSDLSTYQLLIDGLMAKSPDGRFGNVNDILWALRAATGATGSATRGIVAA